MDQIEILKTKQLTILIMKLVVGFGLMGAVTLISYKINNFNVEVKYFGVGFLIAGLTLALFNIVRCSLFIKDQRR